MSNTNYKKITRNWFLRTPVVTFIYFATHILVYPVICQDRGIEYHIDDKVIIDTNSGVELDEVEVICNTKQIKQRSESIPIQIITEEFLKEAQSGNLIQTLSKISGIQSMDIGTGISKPMIRGLGFYRVVVAQNGIRHEGQQWSNHHGIHIDQHAVQHVEVLKGPASLQYGSDAIGGAINILPSHIPLNQGLSGEITGIYRSNNNGTGISGSFTGRKADFYLSATLSHARFSDFQIPVTDSFLLPSPVSAQEASHGAPLGDIVPNTSGNESDMKVTLGVIKNWGNSYFDISYLTLKSGFFSWNGMKNDSIRHFHQSDRTDIQIPYQKTNNLSVMHFTNRYFAQGKLQFSLGYQVNQSSEYDYFYLNSSTDNLNMYLNLRTWSGNLIYYVKTGKSNFTTGINLQNQFHETNGINHILPEYRRSSSGIFTLFKQPVNEKLQINGGIRLDYTSLKINESLNPYPEIIYIDSIFNSVFLKSYLNPSFSVGINYNPHTDISVKGNIGKSYRVPSVYELAAFGLHRHEVRFEKGNTNNKPEEAWQLDLGIDANYRNLNFSVSPFLTWFTNYLYLKPTPNIKPGLGQVYEYNQNEALYTGLESTIQITSNEWKLQSGMEYVYAVNLDQKMAIPFTPPLMMLNELSYSFKRLSFLRKTKIGFEHEFAAAQNYTVPNELSTEGYNLFHFNAVSTVGFGKMPVEFMLKVRNIFNTRYYNHISFYRRMRIPEPGRDIQIFIKIIF